MSLFDTAPMTDYFTPAHNVGCFFDIVTGNGEYIFGKHGQSLMNGGYVPLLSIMGPQNANKSTIARFFEISSVAKYNDGTKDNAKSLRSISYDTENSYGWARHNTLCQNFPELKDTDWGDPSLTGKERLFVLTNLSKMLGDDFYDLLRAEANEIEKQKKRGSRTLTTPFLMPDGTLYKSDLITNVIIDSISMFKFSNLEDNVVDDNQLGSSQTQTLAMREGGAKRQLMTDLPKLISKAGYYTILTSHMGQEIDMGRFAPKRQRLTFSKHGAKPVGATMAFDYINGIIYEIQKVTKLNAAKGVQYPMTEGDKEEGATDLVEVEIVPSRNKSGLSGKRYYVVVSQRRGVDEHLTNFNLIHKRCAMGETFALSGDPSRAFGIKLYPGKSYNRNTIAPELHADPHLARAVEWSMLLSILPYEFPNTDAEFFCDPETLYKEIEALGYNWDILRRTREHWVYEEMEDKNKPSLTIWDLLRMRKGLYTPYFLNPDKTVKKKYLKAMGLDNNDK